MIPPFYANNERNAAAKKLREKTYVFCTLSSYSKSLGSPTFALLELFPSMAEFTATKALFF